MKIFFSGLCLFFIMINQVTAFGPSPGGPSIGSRIVADTISRQVQSRLKPKFVVNSPYAKGATRIVTNQRQLAVLDFSSNVFVWSQANGELVELISNNKKITDMLLMENGDIVTTSDSVVYLYKKGNDKPISLDVGGGVTGLLKLDTEAVIAVHDNGRNTLVLLRKEPRKIGEFNKAKVKAAFTTSKGFYLLTEAGELHNSPGDGEWSLKCDYATDVAQAILANKSLYISSDNGLARYTLGTCSQLAMATVEYNDIAGLVETGTGNIVIISKDKQFVLDSTTLSMLSEIESEGTNLSAWPAGIPGSWFASDGVSLNLWSINSGEQILQARLVVMESGWAYVTNSGQFDGSLDGKTGDRISAIGWAMDDEVFELDQFIESYYSPGLLATIYGKQDLWNKDTPIIADGFLLPPKVVMKRFEMGEDNKLFLSAEMQERGGGLSRVSVFHNNKVIKEYAVDDLQQGEKTWLADGIEIPLNADSKSITVVASSKDNIEGESITRKINMANSVEMEQLNRTLHVVSIGINKYKNTKLNLDFAVPDARSMIETIKQHASDIYSEVKMYSLFNEAADMKNINNVFSSLNSISPYDTILVYMAGHGIALDDEWYYLSNEVVKTDDALLLWEQALSSELLLNHIVNTPAQNVVVMIDACQSGAIIDSFDKQAYKRKLATMARRTGIHIGAASTASQYAAELSLLGHGLFTHTLVNAINGAADQSPKNNRVSLSEVRQFSVGAMRKFIRKLGLPRQQPTFYSTGVDVELAGVKR